MRPFHVLVLGVLTIRDVWVYSDEPPIFLCADATKHQYLVRTVKESDRGRCCFLIPVTQTIITALREERLSLRDAIAGSEERWLWTVWLAHNASQSSRITQFPAWVLHEDDLPQSDFFFHAIL